MTLRYQNMMPSSSWTHIDIDKESYIDMTVWKEVGEDTHSEICGVVLEHVFEADFRHCGERF